MNLIPSAQSFLGKKMDSQQKKYNITMQVIFFLILQRIELRKKWSTTGDQGTESDLPGRGPTTPRICIRIHLGLQLLHPVHSRPGERGGMERALAPPQRAGRSCRGICRGPGEKEQCFCKHQHIPAHDSSTASRNTTLKSIT